MSVVSTAALGSLASQALVLLSEGVSAGAARGLEVDDEGCERGLLCFFGAGAALATAEIESSMGMAVQPELFAKMKNKIFLEGD